MAISLQPSHPGMLSHPWAANATSTSRPEELDFTSLWIGQAPAAGLGTSVEVASAGLPQLTGGADIASAFIAGGPSRLISMQGSRGYYMDAAQGTQGKRLVLNHNKAITKKLASAVHYQQVLDCIADSVQYFDEVNVATALHRLAKLQPPSHAGQTNPVIFAPQFHQLVASVRKLLDRFEAQAISNTMWAFATLSYFPEDHLLEDLAHHAVSIMGTFRPQATSNTLWAFAKLSYCPNKALLHASAVQMLHDLPKSVPQDISNTLWAFATLRHHPGQDLMEAAARQAVLTMQHFKPQEIANTLWSFATLGHDPKEQLLDAMAIQMIARIQQFRPQAVSNTLWAYAKLSYNPGKLLMEVAAQKAMGMLHQYTSQELANTLWALATLEHYPGGAMLDAAAIQIARRIEQFSPQDTANSIWAFAKLFHYPCQELLQGVALYLIRHWARFKANEVSTVFMSLALLRACTPQTWQLLLSRLATVAPTTFDEASLRQIFQTHLLVDAAASMSGLPSMRQSFPQPLLEAAEQAWRASVQKTNKLSVQHQDISRTLWKLGVAHTSEHLTPDGLFCIDICLNGTNVIVDVQEPGDFAMNNRIPLGPTIAKRIMLESRGYTVLGLPLFHWALLETQGQREQYLLSLLASAALAGGPNLLTTGAMVPPVNSSEFATSQSSAELPPVSDALLRLPSIFGSEPFS